jgi:hypothetical protein
MLYDLQQSSKIRTARHVANLHDTDSVKTPQTSVYQENSVSGSSTSSASRKLVSIRIQPPRHGEEGAISSEKLAERLLEMINDPQSKLRATVGLEGIQGHGVRPPPDYNAGKQKCQRVSQPCLIPQHSIPYRIKNPAR